jgi:hypothetical protein
MGGMCSTYRIHIYLLKDWNLCSQVFILLLWKLRHHITSKHWKQSTRLHSVTYQRAESLKLTRICLEQRKWEMIGR